MIFVRQGDKQLRFYNLTLLGILILPLVFHVYVFSVYSFPKLFFFYLLGIVGALFIVYGLSQRESIQIHRKAVIAWLLFLAFNAIATVFAKDKLLALFGNR